MIQKLLIALCLMCVAEPAFAAGRGYLGVWFGTLPATEKAVRTGVIVNKVFPGSAAQRAGLKPGEIVTQIDGVSVRDPETAVGLLAENTANERISLTVVDRSGGGIRRSQVFARLAESPPDGFASIMTAKPPPFRRSAPATAGHCAGPAKTRDRACQVHVEH